jgi:hypothetical protein
VLLSRAQLLRDGISDGSGGRRRGAGRRRGGGVVVVVVVVAAAPRLRSGPGACHVRRLPLKPEHAHASALRARRRRFFFWRRRLGLLFHFDFLVFPRFLFFGGGSGGVEPQERGHQRDSLLGEQQPVRLPGHLEPRLVSAKQQQPRYSSFSSSSSSLSLAPSRSSSAEVKLSYSSAHHSLPSLLYVRVRVCRYDDPDYPKYNNTFENYTSAWIHNVTLTGLEPDTMYYYQVINIPAAPFRT